MSERIHQERTEESPRRFEATPSKSTPLSTKGFAYNDSTATLMRKIKAEQKKNPPPRLVDNRPEAIQMRKLKAHIQEQQKKNPPPRLVDNRPEAIQMRKLKAHIQEQQKIDPFFYLRENTPVQQQTNDATTTEAPLQKKENKTGLPDDLKTGVENLSGLAMDDVKVHYNSPKPAQLQAHAYAQGTDIHLAPGQEKHLPHEAWHVVQQKQGRVKPTTQLKGKVNVNDDPKLEKEADVMGGKAKRLTTENAIKKLDRKNTDSAKTIQKIRIEEGYNIIDYASLYDYIEDDFGIDESMSQDLKDELVALKLKDIDFIKEDYEGITLVIDDQTQLLNFIKLLSKGHESINEIIEKFSPKKNLPHQFHTAKEKGVNEDGLKWLDKNKNNKLAHSFSKAKTVGELTTKWGNDDYSNALKHKKTNSALQALKKGHVTKAKENFIEVLNFRIKQNNDQATLETDEKSKENQRDGHDHFIKVLKGIIEQLDKYPN